MSNLHPSIESAGSRHGRIGMIRIWVGIFGAPVAWVIQMLLSMPIAAHACYPYQAPLSAPIWQGLWGILITIGMACLAIALFSGFSAWNSLREYQRRVSEEGITLRSEHRSRFLIKTGLMSSCLFIVAIVFNICAVLLAPLCSPWF
jgi:hypothetical protein